MGQKPAVMDKKELKTGKVEFKITETSGTFGRFRINNLGRLLFEDKTCGSYIVDKISWPVKNSNCMLNGYSVKAHIYDIYPDCGYKAVITMSWVEAISVRNMLSQHPEFNLTPPVEKASGNEGLIAAELKKRYDREFESFMFNKNVVKVGKALKCYQTPSGFVNMLNVLNSVGTFIR